MILVYAGIHVYAILPWLALALGVTVAPALLLPAAIGVAANVALRAALVLLCVALVWLYFTG